MRTFLDKLYLACGAAAGVFMVGVCVFSVYSIGGGIFGYVARSADEFAGYSMAASSFLALAYTFGHGEHIRVTLVLEKLSGARRRWLELWALFAGSCLAGFLAFYSVKNMYTSWALNDMSQGLIPIPLWIPQIPMAIGTAVLFIALLDKLVQVARGGALLHDIDAKDAHVER